MLRLYGHTVQMQSAPGLTHQNHESSSLFRRGQLVPCLPERLHLIRLTQGDSCEGVHGWEWAANPDVVLLEMIDHGTDGALGVEHHKICPGRNHLQLARCRLALEFVPVKAIPHHGRLVFIVMFKGSKAGA